MAYIRWCAHKAFMKGISINLAAQEKKRKGKLLMDLLLHIQELEVRHKKSPTLTLTRNLLNARNALRDHLLTKRAWVMKTLRTDHYTLSNKLGETKAQNPEILDSPSDSRTGQRTQTK